jgi:hypothetical protein
MWYLSKLLQAKGCPSCDIVVGCNLNGLRQFLSVFVWWVIRYLRLSDQAAIYLREVPTIAGYTDGLS